MPAARPLFVLFLLLGALVAPTGPASGKAEREGPSWVPLRGRIGVGRTWKHEGGHSFPAIDFESNRRSVPVYAAGPGTVLATVSDCEDTTPNGAHTDCNGGQGNLVEIVHPDGRRSRYLHLRSGSITVEPGEHVCLGCQIARSGWSGNVSPPGPEGAHLHYEELRAFEPVDPGPMRARHRHRRVLYPPGGARWPEVGGTGLVISNIGYPPPDHTIPISCEGWAATITGTPQDDRLEGTSGPDIIVGEDGNDTIHGADGDDRICGGDGDDLLVGGPSQDILHGGEGTDTCFQDEEDGYEAARGSLTSCERPPFTLSVEVRCCLRFVTSEPAGISCPPDCSEPYAPQTTVILTLSSGDAYWQGCDTAEGTNFGSTCTLVMRQDRTVSV